MKTSSHSLSRPLDIDIPSELMADIHSRKSDIQSRLEILFGPGPSSAAQITPQRYGSITTAQIRRSLEQKRLNDVLTSSKTVSIDNNDNCEAEYENLNAFTIPSKITPPPSPPLQTQKTATTSTPPPAPPLPASFNFVSCPPPTITSVTIKKINQNVNENISNTNNTNPNPNPMKTFKYSGNSGTRTPLYSKYV